MAAKTVDVFLQDALIESYEIDWGIVHAPLFDQDFIDRARARLSVDGYSEQQIAEARFVIRG